MATPANIEGAPHLTPAQLTTLLSVASGKTAKQIAWDLEISPRTVEQHLRVVRKKLGCWSTPHAVAVGFRLGLLS